VSAIGKLITAFIQPLQQDNISTTHPWPPAGSSSSVSTAALPGAEAAGADAAVAAASSAAIGGSDAAAKDGPAGSSSGSSEGNIVALPHHIYRVHCSLNLNTETGRLSSRRPNLQNQPALEKDRYKVSWCAGCASSFAEDCQLFIFSASLALH
jgi:DNA polymerase-1